MFQVTYNRRLIMAVLMYEDCCFRRYCTYLWTRGKFTHILQQTKEMKRLSDSACVSLCCKDIRHFYPPV